MLNKKETTPRTVLAAGTFDFFHKGHQQFLTDALALGEKLVVIVARDENVMRIKNFSPTENENARKKNIEEWGQKQLSENSKNIEVFLGDTKDFLKIPQKINPDIIALGYDQKVPENFSDFFSGKKIMRLSPHFPEQFKSSFFRGEIKNAKLKNSKPGSS
jgi:cytidyltransferase-like protein